MLTTNHQINKEIIHASSIVRKLLGLKKYFYFENRNDFILFLFMWNRSEGKPVYIQLRLN